MNRHLLTKQGHWGLVRMGKWQSIDWKSLELDEIALWPLFAQCLSLGLFFVVLQCLGTWYFLAPKAEALAYLHQKEKNIASLHQSKLTQLTRFDFLKEELTNLHKNYELATTQLPIERELASLLAAVNELGLKNQLTIRRIDWGKKKAEDFLFQLPLHIQLEGRFSHIGQFSEQIASLPRIINFNEVHWQRIDKNDALVKVNIKASSYQFRQEVENEQ